jgi:hypothetical protein
LPRAELDWMSRDFLCHLYDLVIAETCRLEDGVISGADQPPDLDRPRPATADW